MKQKARRIGACIIGTVATVAISFVLAGPTVAAEPSEPNPKLDMAEILEIQNDMFQVVDPLQALVNPTGTARHETADGEEYGYAGELLDQEHRKLFIFWRGEVEEAAQVILDRQPPSFEIEVVQVPLTLFELDRGLHELMEAAAEGPVMPQAQVTDASLNVRDGGIEVSYYGEAAAGEVREALQGLTSVPVLSATQGESVSAMDTRWYDQSPYTSGAGFRLSTKYCSTAWAARSANTGNYYMVTAKHCSWTVSGSTGNAVNGSLGNWALWKNNSSRNWPSYDSTLLEPGIQSTSKNSFVGTWGSGNEIPWVGIGGNANGVYVCTNGANSGTNCNIIITNKDDSWLIKRPDGTLVAVYGVRGDRVDPGTWAVVNGDSGGPVYTDHPNGGKRVAGLISAGKNAVSCAGGSFFLSPDPSNPEDDDFCSSTVFWIGAVTWENVTGLEIQHT